MGLVGCPGLAVDVLDRGWIGEKRDPRRRGDAAGCDGLGLLGSWILMSERAHGYWIGVDYVTGKSFVVW